MPQVQMLNWRNGEGWIVLSGGSEGEEALDIAAQALTKIRLGEPIAYIWAAGDADEADAHLEQLDDLGAPTGYLVDVLTEDDQTIRERLGEAGMIILGDGREIAKLRNGLTGAAMEGMGEAYARGSVILGIGSGAAVLGSFLDTRDVDSGKGLGWVDGAAVQPNYGDLDSAARLRGLIEQHPESYGLGISEGSALVLGPEGEIETWGSRQVTVVAVASSRDSE